MLTRRVCHSLSRLARPKLSQNPDIFHLMRQRDIEISTIRELNAETFSQNRSYTLQQQLQEQLGLSEKGSIAATQQQLSLIAYTKSLKPYQIRQKLGGSLNLQDINQEIEGRYSPGHENLKYHYSIEEDIPNIPEYQTSGTRAYLFNLPEGISEKEITLELGFRYIKQVEIKYDLMGLPAFAIVDFNSENNLTDRVMSQENEICLNGRICPLMTELDDYKLPLARRQLVIHNLTDGDTPSSLLQNLTQFGHVMHLSCPLEIYREQSVDQIKTLFKDEQDPVRINLFRKDGTIESEYYPAYKAPAELEAHQRMHAEYERRLRYCENIDVYQGESGKIKIKPRGFCVVTFSCQEEAQNCYLNLRKLVKVELKNERDEFYFDQKHREALLRHIDNQYIESCKKNSPDSEAADFNAKLNMVIYQSFYLNLVYQKTRAKFIESGTYYLTELENDALPYQLHYDYKQGLERLAQSIGRGSLNNPSIANEYGRSFSELAEEQLYGHQLSKDRKQRYEVNVDDYVRAEVEPMRSSQQIRRSIRKYRIGAEKGVSFAKTRGLEPSDLLQPLRDSNKFGDLKQKGLQNQNQSQPINYDDQQQDQERNIDMEDLEDLRDIDIDEEFEDYKGPRRRYFSTVRAVPSHRPKTLSQKVRSHMKYNEFVRDVINEYIGVFPADKLQRQFGKNKPTYVNPHNLRFLDGSDFITESEVRRILEFSAIPSETAYEAFVKNNQITKSISIDVQQQILKDLPNNHLKIIQNLTDVGVIVEEYEVGDNDAKELAEELNNEEAEIGEEYRAVTEGGVNKIVKVAKLENIVPLESSQKAKAYLVGVQKQERLDLSKIEIMQKNFESLLRGEPISAEFAKCFDLQEGSIVDLDEIAQELSGQIGISRKDMEKIMNLGNYTDEQLQKDVSRQVELSKVREEVAIKRASDFSRDPSEVKVRGPDGKFVVSKFRQI